MTIPEQAVEAAVAIYFKGHTPRNGERELMRQALEAAQPLMGVQRPEAKCDGSCNEECRPGCMCGVTPEPASPAPQAGCATEGWRERDHRRVTAIIHKIWSFKYQGLRTMEKVSIAEAEMMKAFAEIRAEVAASPPPVAESGWQGGLADKIEKRIRAIPASNPGYISAAPQTLGNVLDRDLLRFIALEAADVAKAAALPAPPHIAAVKS